MKTLTRLLALLLAGLPMMSARAAVKPNIVFIFADDLGWKDTGYTGSDWVSGGLFG